jgi:hypothetical protein
MPLTVAIMVDRRRGHKVHIQSTLYQYHTVGVRYQRVIVYLVQPSPPNSQSLVRIHHPPLVVRSAKLLLLLLLAIGVWVGALIMRLKCIFIGSGRVRLQLHVTTGCLIFCFQCFDSNIVSFN